MSLIPIILCIQVECNEEYVLGTGQTSIVFKGRLDSREVACKKPKEGLRKQLLHEIGMNVFVREQLLDSDLFVQFYGVSDSLSKELIRPSEYSEDSQWEYLVFENCPHGDLNKFINHQVKLLFGDSDHPLDFRGSLPVLSKLVLYLRDVCTALAALNEIGIMHNDIHLEQIMLCSPRSPDSPVLAKLGDLGMASNDPDVLVNDLVGLAFTFVEALFQFVSAPRFERVSARLLQLSGSTYPQFIESFDKFFLNIFNLPKHVVKSLHAYLFFAYSRPESPKLSALIGALLMDSILHRMNIPEQQIYSPAHLKIASESGDHLIVLNMVLAKIFQVTKVLGPSTYQSEITISERNTLVIVKLVTNENREEFTKQFLENLNASEHTEPSLSVLLGVLVYDSNDEPEFRNLRFVPNLALCLFHFEFIHALVLLDT